MEGTKQDSLLQACLPFTVFGIVFVVLLGMHAVAPEWATTTAKAIPISPMVALAATIACSPCQRRQILQAFIAGMRHHMVLQMGLVFVLSGLFAAFGGAIGSIDAIVAVCLRVLPQQWILPGLFIASCITSLAMGTSMGTLAAVVPVTIGVAGSGAASLPVCVATVMGGAMFGDNLSVVSDTTIAATRTQGCSMRSKLLINGPIAVLAAMITVVMLLFLMPAQPPHVLLSAVSINWTVVLPYGAVFSTDDQ